MWWVYALLSAVFASLTAIFAKIGVANVNSNLATAIRTVVILVITWGIVIAKGHWRSLGEISRTSLLFLVVSGVATGLSWLFYFKALQLGKVSLVAPIDNLSVALTIALSIVFLGESPSIKSAIGALLIVAGTVTLIL